MFDYDQATDTVTVYLDKNFNPVTKDKATLIKIVSPNGVTWEAPDSLTVVQKAAKFFSTQLNFELKLANAFLKAGFNPSQERDYHGRWTNALGDEELPPPPEEPDRRFMGFSTKKITSAVNLVGTKLSAHGKEALSAAVAAAASMPAMGGLSDADQEHLKEIVKHYADRMQVPAEEARDYMIGTFRKLKQLTPGLKKAESPEDFVKRIDAIIAALEKLDFKEKGKGNGKRSS
jgi:hypothetical protein